MKIDFSTPGLRTEENDKFKKFWKLVENEAEKQGCFFFSQCGDGHEDENDEMEFSDMFGWLIPKEFYNEALKHYEDMDEDYITLHYDKYFKSMEWESVNGKIIIHFN